jgi:hypothetical protein
LKYFYGWVGILGFVDRLIAGGVKYFKTKSICLPKECLRAVLCARCAVWGREDWLVKGRSFLVHHFWPFFVKRW